jgi:SAM-dependent methyltransferase
MKTDRNYEKILQKITTNSSRQYLRAFLQDAASTIGPGKYVLDAGAGDCPHTELFKQVIYHSTDIQQSSYQRTFISDLISLPIADGKYDLIACTQVLEHVREPEKVLGEFHRILRVGGELWLTAPFYFEEHEVPNDYFRFTQFGIKHLLEKVGFQIRKLEWLEGYSGTLSYEFMKIARMLPIHPGAYGHPILCMPISFIAIFLKPFSYLMSFLFSFLDLLHKHTFSGHPKNYAVIAVKEC